MENGRKKNPIISSTEVKTASHNILLLKLAKDKHFDWPYNSAWDVFNNGARYHTFMFNTGYSDIIYHNDVIFAKSYEEFVENTKIDYTVKDGCILYRVVPKYVPLPLSSHYATSYDGLIVVNMDDDVLNEVDIGVDMPWDYVGREPPHQNPKFTNRIHTLMRTYFSNIAKRNCSISGRTYKNGLSFITVSYTHLTLPTSDLV